MIRWNVSKSNEAIDREQAIAKLRKLTRYCKWGTICTIVALALALLAVIAIELLFILPSLSQGFCLQSVELTAGEGPILALVGANEQTPLMLVAHDGHTAIGSGMMACLALTIAISVRRLFFNIEKEGRPFDLECNQTLRRVGHLFLIGGVAVRLLGAVITGLILSGFGGSFTDAFVGQLFEPSMLFAGLIICLIASIFRYGYILQKQDDELL
jgi:hypothetical protein